MLYEFKSRATGPVVMTGPVAERMLAIVGKDKSTRGIFTVEQMSPAIAALEAAIERERAETPAADTDDDERDGERTNPFTRPVSLAQRAWPLIDMLKAAREADQPVTWG